MTQLDQNAIEQQAFELTIPEEDANLGKRQSVYARTTTFFCYIVAWLIVWLLLTIVICIDVISVHYHPYCSPIVLVLVIPLGVGFEIYFFRMLMKSKTIAIYDNGMLIVGRSERQSVFWEDITVFYDWEKKVFCLLDILSKISYEYFEIKEIKILTDDMVIKIPNGYGVNSQVLFDTISDHIEPYLTKKAMNRIAQGEMVSFGALHINQNGLHYKWRFLMWYKQKFLAWEDFDYLVQQKDDVLRQYVVTFYQTGLKIWESIPERKLFNVNTMISLVRTIHKTDLQTRWLRSLRCRPNNNLLIQRLFKFVQRLAVIREVGKAFNLRQVREGKHLFCNRRRNRLGLTFDEELVCVRIR